MSRDENGILGRVKRAFIFLPEFLFMKRTYCLAVHDLIMAQRNAVDARKSEEVGKITFKSNGDEALSDESL
jgi:hypothetical protein